MNHQQGALSAHDDPKEVLGLDVGASEEEIRAAYLRKVKEFPPERAPAEFERIRDAYEILRDPQRRMAHMLFSVDPMAPLVSLIARRPAARKFVGPEPWLAVIRKK
jgi:preprotein translocase subunit Sec63